MIKGDWIGKGVEGSGHGLIRDIKGEIPPSPPVTIVIVPTDIRIGHPRRKLSSGTLESAFLVECVVLYLLPCTPSWRRALSDLSAPLLLRARSYNTWA
jgi:hypothetical protein